MVSEFGTRFLKYVKLFPGRKILDVLVLAAMLLASCRPQTIRPQDKDSVQQIGKALFWYRNDYEPPVFTHPEPVTSTRPGEDAGRGSGGPSIMFVENVGQFDEKALFQAKSELGTIHLAHDAFWITLLAPDTLSEVSNTNSSDLIIPLGDGRQPVATPAPHQNDEDAAGVNLRLTFPGSNPQARAEGFGPLDTTVTYFTGDNSSNWQKDVPVWSGVRYVDFYPGYDLEITSKGDRLAWALVQKATESLQPMNNQTRFKIEGGRLIGDY